MDAATIDRLQRDWDAMMRARASKLAPEARARVKAALDLDGRAWTEAMRNVHLLERWEHPASAKYRAAVESVLAKEGV